MDPGVRTTASSAAITQPSLQSRASARAEERQQALLRRPRPASGRKITTVARGRIRRIRPHALKHGSGSPLRPNERSAAHAHELPATNEMRLEYSWPTIRVRDQRLKLAEIENMEEESCALACLDQGCTDGSPVSVLVHLRDDRDRVAHLAHACSQIQWRNGRWGPERWQIVLDRCPVGAVDRTSGPKASDGAPELPDRGQDALVNRRGTASRRP